MPRPNGPQFIHLLDEEDRKHAFKVLYHGTPREIPEGEHISPEKSSRPGRNLSFATPSLSAARRFSKNDVGELGYVYQVEPVDTEDLNSTWVQPMKYARKGSIEVASNKGFRIIKRIHPRA